MERLHKHPAVWIRWMKIRCYLWTGYCPSTLPMLQPPLCGWCSWWWWWCLDLMLCTGAQMYRRHAGGENDGMESLWVWPARKVPVTRAGAEMIKWDQLCCEIQEVQRRVSQSLSSEFWWFKYRNEALLQMKRIQPYVLILFHGGKKGDWNIYCISCVSI